MKILFQLGSIRKGTAGIETNGTFERVMGFTLVEADRYPSTQIGILQPSQGEERAFDSTDFAQSRG
jgi:hypothetical protein